MTCFKTLFSDPCWQTNLFALIMCYELIGSTVVCVFIQSVNWPKQEMSILTNPSWAGTVYSVCARLHVLVTTFFRHVSFRCNLHMGCSVTADYLFRSSAINEVRHEMCILLVEIPVSVLAFPQSLPNTPHSPITGSTVVNEFNTNMHTAV